MISTQFIRSSLRAVQASTKSSATSTLISRFSGLSALRFCPPARFDSKPIRWLSSSPRADEDQSSSPAPVPTHEELFAVYLSNLSFSVSEELLTEFISQYAPVKKVDVVRSSDGAARGFGFAKFATQAEAEAAVNAINGLDFLGRPLSAAISIRRPVIATASNQLFMSGFPTDGEADEASLRQALQEKLDMQPRVIRFHKFPGGFLKGTGHIEFEDEASVETALVKLQQLGPDSPVKVAGRALTLVKARPLLQSRTRARGGFDGGRGGYGGSRGFPGGQGGYGPQDGYPGFGAPGGYGAPPPYGGGYNASYPGAPPSGGYGGPPYGRGSGENSGGHSSPY